LKNLNRAIRWGVAGTIGLFGVLLVVIGGAICAVASWVLHE